MKIKELIARCISANQEKQVYAKTEDAVFFEVDKVQTTPDGDVVLVEGDEVEIDDGSEAE